jgi:hypothetical protein
MFFFILSLLLNLVFNIIKIVDIVIVFIYKQYCMSVIIIMLMVIQLRHCVVININRPSAIEIQCIEYFMCKVSCWTPTISDSDFLFNLHLFNYTLKTNIEKIELANLTTTVMLVAYFDSCFIIIR